ncbi:MAG: DUF4920 domain-containing protein [Crocinitomicaceae bacterium]
MKYALGLFALPLAMISCGSDAETTDETTDAPATDSIEVVNEEVVEENTLAFDGVEAGDYTLFGYSEITAENAVSSDEMFAQFEETGAFNDKVAVTINEVCKKAGCWITFKDSKDNDVRVFFKDHFGIPTETASGTEAILYGSLVMDTVTVDFQKHLLDDAKEAGEEVAQSEYDAITEDKIEASFECESILVGK